VGIASVRS